MEVVMLHMPLCFKHGSWHMIFEHLVQVCWSRTALDHWPGQVTENLMYFASTHVIFFSKIQSKSTSRALACAENILYFLVLFKENMRNKLEQVCLWFPDLFKGTVHGRSKVGRQGRICKSVLLHAPWVGRRQWQTVWHYSHMNHFMDALVLRTMWITALAFLKQDGKIWNNCKWRRNPGNWMEKQTSF